MSIVASILSLITCSHKPKDDSRLVSFEYHYDGTIGGNTHSYKVKVKDGIATFTVRDMRHCRFQEITDTVSQEFLNQLEALCMKHKVWHFDGYRKTNPYVCDGRGFSLYISFSDGTKVNAYGMNMKPSGYREFEEDMHALFKPECERLFGKCEEAGNEQ